MQTQTKPQTTGTKPAETKQTGAKPVETPKPATAKPATGKIPSQGLVDAKKKSNSEQRKKAKIVRFTARYANLGARIKTRETRTAVLKKQQSELKSEIESLGGSIV